MEPGVCGWLIPAGSVEALADAMQEALEAPVERLEQMGKTGALRVSQQHNVAVEAKNLVVLFQGAMKDS